MRKTVLFLLFLFARSVHATGLSGELGLEAGVIQAPASALKTSSYYRLYLQEAEDLTPELSFHLGGEADWQTFFSPGQVSWPLFPRPNLWRAETDNVATSQGIDLTLLRLDRAQLHFASGSLEASAGLLKPDWGSSFFYRPTDYFFPLAPLTWEREQPLGSEGLDASLFLFDDLSLEGAARWLDGGAAEGVVRLVDKGIGLTVTPSFAWMTGRNGAGLELMGTLPTFQVRVEGVDWLFADGHTAVDWILGVSTHHEGMTYNAEVLRDGTGQLLAAFSSLSASATYVFLSTEGSFLGKWKAAPALVAPLEGGPFLFWPKLTWGFAPSWEAGFQAQMLLGNWKGPLDLFPGRAGLSMQYSF